MGAPGVATFSTHKIQDLMAHVLNTFFFLLRQIPAEGNFEEKFERKNHFFQKKTGQGKFERKLERKFERKFERKIRFFQKKVGTREI